MKRFDTGTSAIASEIGVSQIPRKLSPDTMSANNSAASNAPKILIIVCVDFMLTILATGGGLSQTRYWERARFVGRSYIDPTELARAQISSRTTSELAAASRFRIA